MAKGGGKSSGGGSKPSGGGSKPSVSLPSKASKTPTPTFIPTAKPSGGSGSSGNKKQDRVKNLTKQANQLIASASGGAIADPAKFKDILSKLKKLGKDERVKDLRSKKQSAVAASRPKDQSPTNLDNSEDTSTTIDNSVFENYPTTEFLPGYGDSGSGYSSSTSSTSSGPSWEEGYSQDLSNWLDQYKNEQAGRAADYESMLSDLVSQEGTFDPERFRSLLLELESSKKRQKEWNERSAREAYKY